MMPNTRALCVSSSERSSLVAAAAGLTLCRARRAKTSPERATGSWFWLGVDVPLLPPSNALRKRAGVGVTSGESGNEAPATAGDADLHVGAVRGVGRPCGLACGHFDDASSLTALWRGVVGGDWRRDCIVESSACDRLCSTLGLRLSLPSDESSTQGSLRFFVPGGDGIDGEGRRLEDVGGG